MLSNGTGTYFMSLGSALASQNLYPKVLVYERVLKTTRQWLLGLMPVKLEWIEEAISNGRLKVHPITQFEHNILMESPFRIGWEDV